MKFIESTKNKINPDENSENVLYLEVTEVVFVNCEIVNKYYKHGWRVLYTFIPKKSFGQSLDNSPKNYMFFKTSISEFSYIEVWVTNLNSKPVDIIFVTNRIVKLKIKGLFSSSYISIICNKLWIFRSFEKNMNKQFVKI